MALAPIALTLALVAGIAMAVQAPTNAMLARALGSPVTAALVSFLIGSLALAAFALFLPGRADGAAVRALPWYAWAGGIYGAFFVAVAAFGAPRVGVAALLTAAVAGQLIAAVALDHMGALGLEKQPVSAGRLIGLLLVMAGVVLVRRG